MDQKSLGREREKKLNANFKISSEIGGQRKTVCSRVVKQLEKLIFQLVKRGYHQQTLCQWISGYLSVRFGRVLFFSRIWLSNLTLGGKNWKSCWIKWKWMTVSKNKKFGRCSNNLSVCSLVKIKIISHTVHEITIRQQLRQRSKIICLPVTALVSWKIELYRLCNKL